MTKIKSYTDIEQSKKLAEILPLESADGFWGYHDKWCSESEDWEGYEDYPNAVPYLEYTRNENEWKEDKSDVPCWSLAALFSVLPFEDFTMPQLIGTPKTLYRCMYNDDLKSHAYDNPIDACYEMILKLHELKML